MKYEMIFGNEWLFFDAQKDCEMVGNGHHKVENGKLMVWNFSEKYWTESHTDKITIQAMRRIIAEPKHWTWEDKKAGVLPPVGIRCVWVDLSDTKSPDDLLYPEVGTEIEIVANTKTYDGKYPVSVFKWLHDDGETQCYAASGHVEDFKPIETPAEKAQREENEFVKSEMKNTTLSMEWSCVYERGLRAAYRKLKGGE